jgi:3-deoxy-7-phosphoheptulonate synthase
METIMNSQSRQAAQQLIDSLPTPDYSVNFQPTYQDQAALLAAVHELHQTKPVTSAREINKLQNTFTKIAVGEETIPVIITGNCAEPVDLLIPIYDLARRSVGHPAIIGQSKLWRSICIERGRGQNTKPRSNEFEIDQDGVVRPSYMGDAVNGRALDAREPDPRRMIAAAVQARDIETVIRKETGLHYPAAHEALLLPYEMSFMKTDIEGKKHLLSCDLPWIGVRTSDPDGAHVELLSDVENSVGVKLGPDTTPELVEGLTEKLNSQGRPGKLLFMLRMGLQRGDVMEQTLKAIKELSPGALVMYDMHGSTTTLEDGTKVRAVENIIAEAKLLARTCGSLGMKLNGIHLETTLQAERIECPYVADELPTHPGNIDPQLNPHQTLFVLNSLASVLQ